MRTAIILAAAMVAGAIYEASGTHIGDGLVGSTVCMSIGSLLCDVVEASNK